MQQFHIVLAGNPNAGKTSVFNALCGRKNPVGNYSGVTVERVSGAFSAGGSEFLVTDLPGIYSLKTQSPDEKVAADIILRRRSDVPPADLVLFVLDTSNLRRNLYLLSQISETGIPVAVVLTMSDHVNRHSAVPDSEHLQSSLEKLLPFPVLDISGYQVEKIEEVRQFIGKVVLAGGRPRPVIRYPRTFSRLASLWLERNPGRTLFEAHEALVSADEPLARKSAYGVSRYIATRYEWAGRIADKLKLASFRDKLTMRLDRVLMHRFWGLLIFAAIMLGIFHAIYFGATPLMDAIGSGADALRDTIRATLPVGWLRSLLADGIVGGVGSVVTFVPQIAILFLGIALLEASGYLSRAAMMTDRLLGWTGLNGRAFIPMLSCFACAVPGIMATRVMSEPRARLLAILIAPFISCSARLPVYILFISAFIQPRYGSSVAALSLFIMHGLGLAIALLLATILNGGFLKIPATPFIFELPSYRLPRWRDIWYRVASKVSDFLRTAGTVIMVMSLVIWFLSYFPQPANGASADPTVTLENSYLARAGKAIQPVFDPIGYDWKITVAILGAFPAREVLIATLGILYQTGESDAGLIQAMQSETRSDGNPLYTLEVALSLMVFFALSAQCMSTLAVIRKETGSLFISVGVFVFMTSLAWVMALLTSHLFAG